VRRKDPCPCRSGRKHKLMLHRVGGSWSDTAVAQCVLLSDHVPGVDRHILLGLLLVAPTQEAFLFHSSMNSPGLPDPRYVLSWPQAVQQVGGNGRQPGMRVREEGDPA